MICKIGAAAAAGLTATLLLTGAAGANTFQPDQSIGGFTVVSKQDPECKEDGTGGKKKQGEDAPAEAAPSAPGAAGSDPSSPDPAPAPSAPEPAAGILPSTGSATGKTTREPGGEAEKPAPQKKECKTDGADKSKGADKGKSETEPSGGAEAESPSGSEAQPQTAPESAPAAPAARTTH